MSEAGRAVALEVIEHVRKGERPVLGKIIKKHGYTKSISLHPGKVTKTKDYQAVISDFVKALDEKRKRAISHINEGKLKKSSARDLAYITDTLTKNHQLLSGGHTEDVKFTWE